MKRNLLLLLFAVVTSVAMAEVITPEQALQQAQGFMQQREAVGSRPRRAPGLQATRLKLAGQVSGLYVFNVADNGGFVIVSNDDRTRPILGYADSGNLDINAIPENMQAWLAGYADEIAWVKRQPAQRRRSVPGRIKRRLGSHSTAAIEPLVTSQWSQGAPYNNLCPVYNGSDRAVTGCVATATAQVMNYHQWPKSATAAIPGYTTPSYGIALGDLPATTFDWDNMQDHYTGGETEDQKTAVAKLMQYCGRAVQMNYGPSSSASSNNVSDALTKYFDYNASTVKLVSRNAYTYANWIDLIYHELSQARPVIYSAATLEGGHAFVCDGYVYEQNTDFFHINWGWGGMSDDYFVLSVLDPDEQGIGGNDSDSGYRYDQTTIIGIQPSTGTGTVADITPNVINLTMNSMKLSCVGVDTPVSTLKVDMGTEVNITLNITNHSSDDFDGTISVGTYSQPFLITTNIAIQAGATEDFVVSFTPTEAITYNMVFLYPDAFGSYYFGEEGATLISTAPTVFGVTNITGTSADVVWSGDAAAVSYDLKYAKGEPAVLPDVIANFDDSTLGQWTTIDADGDGNCWEMITACTSYCDPFEKGYGHNGSADMLLSGSYSNFKGALTPDNYLVSPLVTLGGRVTFWAYAMDSNYFAEHFGVAVSTSGNTNAADFTTIQEWTMDAGNEWKKYSVDLSAYAGQQGYVAIRHFGITDQFVICIDDVLIEQPDDESAWTFVRNITDTSYTLTDLEKETLYSVGVRANLSTGEQSEWQKATFTTIALTDGLVYWIQDVGTGQFISQGAEWGTRATVQDVGGLGFQVVRVGDGVYRLKNVMWNKGNNADLGLRTADLFCDQDAGDITLFGSGAGFKLNTVDGGYLCNNGTVNPDGVKRLGSTSNASQATTWRFLTKNEYDAAIQAYHDSKAAEYAAQLGLDATSVSELETVIGSSGQFLARDYTSSITNASLASSWDGWTHAAASGCNRSEGPAVGQGCAEFWNGCGVATQTVSGLPNGLYKVEFVGMFRPKNAAEARNISSEEASSPAYVYANDAKTEFLHWIDIPAQANNRNGITKDNGYGQSFYTYVSDGTLALGIVQGCWVGGYMWCPFGQFTLTYYDGSVDFSVYEAQWAQLVLDAAEAIEDHPNVTGSELEVLEDAMGDSPEGCGVKETYIEKLDALIDAVNNFIDAVYYYDRYVDYRDETIALFGSDLDIEAPGSASEAVLAVQDLNVAQYDKVAADYTYSATSLIGDLAEWEGTATVAGAPATPHSLSNQHWSGEVHAYYEQAANGWGNTNWTVKYEKKCVLPAGNYVLKVAARSSGSAVTSSMSCSATDIAIALPAEGAVGRGIAMNGKASWDDTDDFVSSDGVENAGAGWQWRFLPFTVTETGEVTMTFYGEAEGKYQWMSIADAELLSTTNVIDDTPTGMATLGDARLTLGDEVVYTLAGQKVRADVLGQSGRAALQKGIYIVRGKKVVVK